MPTCTNCANKWTWKQKIKTLFKLKCPYCGKKQFESASSRRKNGIFGVIILIILLLVVVWFNISVGVALILAMITAAIIFGLYLFTFKFSKLTDLYFIYLLYFFL